MEKVFLSDVLKAIKKAYIWNDDISQQILEKEIKQLPSAEKTGRWENRPDDIPNCSECGYIPEFNRYIDDYYYSDYCPNCGARMKGEI